MHDECLTKEAKRLFPCVASFRGYHLVGGTALALQIGHRISYDFDLFTHTLLHADLFKKIQKIFCGEKIVTSFKSAEQYDIFVSGIKVTFRYYPYLPTYPFKKYQGVPILSIKDIGATKAFAIGQRAAYRDYIDMYFILHEKHATLDQVIHLAEKKYGDDFNARLFLEQLVYLGDIVDKKVEFLRSALTDKQLMIDLKREVKEYIQSSV